MDHKKRQNPEYQENEPKKQKMDIPKTKEETEELIAKIKKQLSEKLLNMEKKKREQEEMQRRILGVNANTFLNNINPIGTSARPMISDTTKREIQEAKERAMAQVAKFSQFSKIPQVSQRNSTKRGLQVEAHPALQHLYEKNGSDELGNKIPFALIPKANFATAKANQRINQTLTKKKQFKIEKPNIEAFADPVKNPYFDPDLGAESIAPKARKSRSFKFARKGKYIEQANHMRDQARLEKLKQEIAESVKKTGMDVELDLVSDLSVKKDPPPDIEWWDEPLLKDPNNMGLIEENINFDTDNGSIITMYIQHPIKISPPVDKGPPPPKPLMLTKKERKKLRRQRRLEEQHEKQDKIRMGLLPPDQPKVKISNLMRVLGNEAVQDPTMIEAKVRDQMQSRQNAHKKHNEEKKLTKEQKREKIRKKLTEDTSKLVQVAVFKVNDLSDGQKRYKVDINAQQLYLTGIVIVCPMQCLVVIEGGPKAIKQYKKLMLRRIDWSDSKKNIDDEEIDNNQEKQENHKENKCVLVWEGSIKERLFRNGFKFKPCPTEYKARELLEKYSASHYWDLAKNYVEPTL